MNAAKDGAEKRAFWGRVSGGYTFKAMLLALLVLIMLIPLTMISSLVYDRQRTAQEAENGIMEAWGSELTLAGPALLIPGVSTGELRTKSEKDGDTIQIIETPFTLVIAPETLNIETDFTTEIRKRGIFSVPLFGGNLSLSGNFDTERALSKLAQNEKLNFEEAEIVVTLSSQKGIRKIGKAVWRGENLFFQPGGRALYLAKNAKNGIFASIPGGFSEKKADFRIEMEIQGGKSASFLPFGMDTSVKMASDWPSPSFQGAFLPAESNITDSGFGADWQVSYLSRDIPLFWKENSAKTGASEEKARQNAYDASLFGVNFFSPINTYSLNERAVKYAILFIIIPFLALFLLEVFSRKRIHFVPYLLSGIANAIFYLLLLSLSEQLPFFTAYLAAALATTLLLSLYSRSLLPAWRQSLYYAGVVTLSYTLLYAVLNAESYALLIGSTGAFLVTAMVMFVTRKLNWYGADLAELPQQQT